MKRQRRDRERINIYLNDKYSFSLSFKSAEDLVVGQTLSSADKEKLLEVDLIEKAYKKARRFVDYRPRSVKEVSDRLIKYGFELKIVRNVVENLKNNNLLDDSQFAEMWVENRRTFRPRSKRLMRKELMFKGVDECNIEVVLDNVDELVDARQLAYSKITKFSQLSSDLLRKRIWSLLARNGFEYDIISDVVNEMIQLEMDTED